jgi:dihydroorotate dehydrogenase electron transfer subunit
VSEPAQPAERARPGAQTPLWIERARPGDVPSIVAIARASLREAWSGPAYAEQLSLPHARVAVARASERGAAGVVGYSIAHRVADELHILSVAVDPARRRQGVARALLESQLREGVRGGARVAWLEVRAGAGSIPAHQLYTRLGFLRVAVRARYYADGEDALVMTLALEPERAQGPVRVRAKVIANRAEGRSFRLVLRTPRWPGFEPGQFLMLSPGPVGAVARLDPLLPRPMAVYRAAPIAGGAADVEVLYKVSGRGTGLLAAAVPGDEIGVVGPLGHGFATDAGVTANRALLVGGGTGIASLYELAARLVAPAEGARQGASGVRVLLGARTADDVMGLEDFAGLGVGLELATEDGSRGERGLVTTLLERALGEGPAVVYACGPTPMMRRAAELAAAAGQRCLVSLENPMACGFGVCLGCAAPRADGGFSLVCRDGPVFDAEAIAWDELA